ncbi:MAG: cytochrome c oxidase subunit II [Gammaproteobacteria bacterium]|nr:cytochrome c oxidase subunit II [Gammaproteobacteria bacterium]MBI5615285.1 cytochrome c oxidase subunit II [Gammaproteobacteria bacterium]
MSARSLAQTLSLRIGVLLAASLPVAWTSAGAGEHEAAVAKIKDAAEGWNELWREVIIDITIMGVIFALVTAYLLVKYRRRSPDQEGTPPKFNAALAVGWTVIPVFVFLSDDLFVAAKGWNLWNMYRQVPAERMEIKLESGMYSWDYVYPNGVHAQNELRVPAGKPIMLRMTSRDTIHSHFIPDFRVKEDSMPGRVTYLWFSPKEPGEHVISCAAYCGIMHSYMMGKLVIMPDQDFTKWYDGEAAKLADAKKNVALN